MAVPWPGSSLDQVPAEMAQRCSAQLQRLTDTVCRDEICTLDFSLTIADPAKPDCPLVACSLGFTELTGYSLHEILGRNCRFLLNGVPEYCINQETRVQARAFCAMAADGIEYSQIVSNPTKEDTPLWVRNLAKGELLAVQTNARKSGELFRNMFYLRMVELDDKQYVLGLQAGLDDAAGGDIEDVIETSFVAEDLEVQSEATYRMLERNMDTIELILASQFWYSGSMRRQF